MTHTLGGEQPPVSAQDAMSGGMVTFSVPGLPVAQPRARIVTHDGVTRAYTPKEAVAHQHTIRFYAQKANVPHIDAGAVRLHVTFVRPYPASMSKRRRESGVVPETRPDLDNYLKAVMDALNGVAWRDDGQIAETVTRKVYGAVPETRISVGVLSPASGQEGS